MPPPIKPKEMIEKLKVEFAEAGLGLLPVKVYSIAGKDVVFIGVEPSFSHANAAIVEDRLRKTIGEEVIFVVVPVIRP